MANALRHLLLLQTLADLDTDTLAVILPHLSASARHLICECVANVLHNPQLPPDEAHELKAVLSPKLADLRTLLAPSTSGQERVHLLPHLARQINLALVITIHHLMSVAPSTG